MMQRLLLLSAALSLYPTFGYSQLPSQLFDSLVPQKLFTTAFLLQEANTTTSYPQYTTRDTGKWLFFGADTWTSGFFPATMYALAERAELCPCSMNGSTSDEWLKLGRAFAAGLIPLETHTTVGHDVGFLSVPFVDELAVNPQNATAQQAVEAFGAALAARFNPVVGCTMSWDSTDPMQFPVIIDNMMTLEVLFNAADLTGNDTLREIAKSHANKTMMNHVRPDGSSYQLVYYDPTTGAVVSKHTVQGYSDNSTWTRGQAWGIYGFANMYRRTQVVDYLDTARRMADYFLDNIPADGVVPWDFDAPTVPPRPADSSAAMIAANGLLLLATQEQSIVPINESAVSYYTNAAIQILNDTTNAFWAPTWQSLLSNGTVNNPASPPNNLTGIIYGDYYFIKTGNDLVRQGIATCP